MNVASIVSWLERHRIEAGIFLLAFALRFALLGVNMHFTSAGIEGVVYRHDGYYEIARNLLDGNGFSRALRPPFIPDPLRTPLYPLFVAAILGLFQSFWAMALIQILVGSVIPILGMRISQRIVPAKIMAGLVGILLVVEPLSVLYSFVFYTETHFILLFFLFLLVFLDYLEKGGTWRIAGSSLLLGLATLTKPTVQYLPVFAVALLLWRGWKDRSRRLWAHVFILLVVYLVCISPWLYRNYRTFGAVGLSAQPAFNLYRYLVPTVLAIENGTTFRLEQEALSKRHATSEDDIDLASSGGFIVRSLHILGNHPASLAKATGMSLVTFFTHDGLLAVLKHAGQEVTLRLPGGTVVAAFRSPGQVARSMRGALRSPAILIVIGRLVWIIIAVMFFVGAFRYLKAEGLTAPGLWALFLVTYFALTTVINGFGVYARFRMPVNVFIFTFVLYAVRDLGRRHQPSYGLPESRPG